MSRPGRALLCSVVSWGSGIALLALLAVYAFLAGPLTLQRPSTVLTNSHWVQRGSVPSLLFFQDVAKRVPKGATILLVESSSSKPGDVQIHLLLALSQMPDLNVISIYDFMLNQRQRPAAPYAAFSGGELHSPWYRLIHHSAAGNLYEAVR